MHTNIRQLAAVALALGVSSAALAQSVIYRETFGNNTGGNLAANNAGIGWSYFNTATQGGNIANNSSVTIISNGASQPANLDNVNAGASLSQTNGFVFAATSAQGLVFTNEYTVDRSAFSINTVSWLANRDFGAGSAPRTALAVQVGGSWYVANLPVTTNLGGTSNTGLSPNTAFSVNFATATWNTLTATVGSPFSVGSTVALPSGNLTGFGIYFTDMNTATSRYDTFAITATAIPEPSAFAALAGLGALGLAATRRRRRA